MTVNARWLFRLGTFLILIASTEAGLADQEQLRKHLPDVLPDGVHVPRPSTPSPLRTWPGVRPYLSPVNAAGGG